MSPRPIYISHHNEQRNNVGTVEIEIGIEIAIAIGIEKK